MIRPTPKSAPPRRGGSTLAALILGLPLAAITVALFRVGPLRHSPAARFVEWPVQWAVVAFFCVALAAQFLKWLRLRVEFDAFDRDLLPRWDGTPAPLDKATELLGTLDRQPDRVQETYLGRRVRGVLEFLGQRRSADNLDDHLRTLADNDSMAQDNSFALIRFLTWAIPILGFLGTVLGITAAISGVSPEMLEDNVDRLTGGLAEAFDSTALALGLTMVTMFLTYLVERREQALIEDVDRFTDRQLAHRFEQEPTPAASAEVIAQQTTAALCGAVEGLIQRQSELWAAALHEPERRAAETFQLLTQQMVAGLSEAMQRTLAAHDERLRSLEQQTIQGGAQLMQQLASLAIAVRDTGREQQQSLARVAESIAAQAAVLAKIQEDESNLVHLQAVLHQNLAALASASSFEEAVHSLTAAVHLLTTRTSGTPVTLRRAA